MRTNQSNRRGVKNLALTSAFALTLALPLLAAGPARAQETKSASGDEQAVRQTIEAYGTGSGKRNAEQVGALWTTDAEYVSAGGERVEGREAIVKRLVDYRAHHPGDRINLTVEKVRFLTDGVAQVDGNAEVRGPEGPPDVSPYLAVLVKKDGKWLLDNVRDLGTESNDTPQAAEKLKALEWLVGEWQQNGGGTTVQANCRWDKSQKFLLWDYSVKTGDKEVMTVTQRIGWDPLTGQYRSWVFDSEGGFAEGRWDKDESAWAIRQSGVLPDGGTASATAVLTPVDKDTFGWRLTNRRVDGERLPDVEVRFSRSSSQAKAR